MMNYIKNIYEKQKTTTQTEFDPLFFLNNTLRKMDDHIILKLEIARLLRIQREQQLAECNTLYFQLLVCIYLYILFGKNKYHFIDNRLFSFIFMNFFIIHYYNYYFLYYNYRNMVLIKIIKLMNYPKILSNY